jgi:hypothetical protein
MPTKHPRHAITETPAVRTVLDRLREESGEVKLDWGELVMLGAEEKMKLIRAEKEKVSSIRRQAADEIRQGAGAGDIAAADEVKRSGWVSS